jgi:hypothetical protein
MLLLAHSQARPKNGRVAAPESDIERRPGFPRQKSSGTSRTNACYRCGMPCIGQSLCPLGARSPRMDCHRPGTRRRRNRQLHQRRHDGRGGAQPDSARALSPANLKPHMKLRSTARPSPRLAATF